MLPLTAESLEASREYQARHGLDAADALIYAAVLLDAQNRPDGDRRIFVTRNSNDFNKDLIRQELQQAGCELLFDFTEVVIEPVQEQNHEGPPIGPS